MISSNKIAAAYIRVSSDDQLEYSPDSQLKLIREYAKKNNYLLDEGQIYSDDGISAKSTQKRDAFNMMIAMSKNDPKPFDVILVWKFSRFARNQEESIVYKSLLAKRGIEVISISEPIIEGPFGSLIERIIEWMDEYYLINLSSEVKRGMKEAAMRGKPVFAPPLGYDMRDGKFIPNEKAEIIKEIYTSFNSGEKMRAIASRLNARGIRTVHGNPLDNRGIEYILRNPVYIGKIRWSESGRTVSRRIFDSPCSVVSNGQHMPIIEEDLWYKTQEKINIQKQAYRKYQRSEQPVQFMLKGLVKCSSCGATLTHTSGEYLQCHNYSKGRCKVSHSVSIKSANEAIIKALAESINKLDFNILSVPKSKDKIDDIKRLIELEEKKLNKIKKAYQEGVDTLDEYRKGKKKIYDKIHLYKEKLQNSKSSDMADLSLYANKTLDVLETITCMDATEESKNFALRSIITEIIFDRSRSIFTINFY